MSCCDIIIVQGEHGKRSTPFFIRFSSEAKIQETIDIHVVNKRIVRKHEQSEIDSQRVWEEFAGEGTIEDYTKSKLSMVLDPDQTVPYFTRIDTVSYEKLPGKKLTKIYSAKDAIEKQDEVQPADEVQEQKMKEIQEHHDVRTSWMDKLINSEQRLADMSLDMVYDPSMLTPTPEEIELMKLKHGYNTVHFVRRDAKGDIVETVTGHLFVWDSDQKLVLCDVDGTITKTDKIGILKTYMGDYTYTQPGIASLLTAITDNGYKLIYLTARGITHGESTRKFIQHIEQENHHKMPQGAILTSYNTFMHAALREYFYKRSDTFKIAALKMIRQLFPADTNPFAAGFGNKISDHKAYLSVGIPLEKIFIVDVSRIQQWIYQY
jgi:phosphatidate phosphatase PAH1